MDIRQLADDETVVLVSDLHIGGSGGDEIFASAPELTEFLVELQRTPGPVQLVIVGDFFDVERMGDPSAAREGISHTLSRGRLSRPVGGISAVPTGRWPPRGLRDRQP